MKTVRQRVLSFIAKKRSASAREISLVLKMSTANVRHHLRVLVSDGRLEMVNSVKHDGKGRPEKVYSLPQAVLGDNLSALSEALLEEAGPNVHMKALAKRIVSESDFAGQPMTKRLNLVIEKLNQMNYHGRWEAGPTGPRIIFGHCPYASIIAKHPELCIMDAALLENFMGDTADQLTKIGRDGSVSCVFLLKQKP